MSDPQMVLGVCAGARTPARVALYDGHAFIEAVAEFASITEARAAIHAANATISAFMTRDGRLPA